MKKLILGILLLSLASCQPYAKYSINADRSNYLTDSYTRTEDGCITFKEKCGCGPDRKVTLCGSYTITENKDYRRKK